MTTTTVNFGPSTLVVRAGENTEIAMEAAASAAQSALEVKGALPLLDRAGYHGIPSIEAAGPFASDGGEAAFGDGYYRAQLTAGTALTTLADWAFARTGSAFKTVSGALVSVATNTPRIGADGILIERASTNLQTYSQDRTNAAWFKLNATVSADATAAPDSTTTADKLVETTDAGIHTAIGGATIIAATKYVYSEFVKASERTKIKLVENNGSGANASFDLAAGTVTAESSAGVGGIEALANGWFRIWIKFTSGGAQTSANIQPRILDTGGNESYTGDGTSGLFLWGAQLELGDTPSSYIPTTSAAVTRPIELASYSVANAGDGAIVIEAIPGAAKSPQNMLADWIDTTTGDRIFIAMNTDRQVFVKVTVNSVATDTFLGTVAVGQSCRVGVAWDASGTRFTMNGVHYGSIAAFPASLNEITVGTDNGGDFALDGTVAKVLTFGAAPSAEDMKAATSFAPGSSVSIKSRSIRVAAADSPWRNSADLLCDGTGDQAEINTAIAACSSDGGSVLLSNGTYNVAASDLSSYGTLSKQDPNAEVTGAVLMTASRCELRGESREGTILYLVDDQVCNVIRSIGDGLKKQAIRSLTIEPNRDNNTSPDTFSTGRQWLETCGIKNRTTGSTPSEAMIVEDVIIGKSDGLGFYAWGNDVHLRHSLVYAAFHDMAELIGGKGGSIENCTGIVEDDDVSYYGFGTDQFDDFRIAGNTLWVKAGGRLLCGIRTWHEGRSHGSVISNNIFTDGATVGAINTVPGRIDAMCHGMSLLTDWTGNTFRGHTDPGGWGKSKVYLNTTNQFQGNPCSDVEFINNHDGSVTGVVLPTVAQGKAVITRNPLDNCTAPAAHAQLVFADNDEFTL